MAASIVPGKAMAISFFLFLACVKLSAGEVYTVGDSAGWTIIGNVNYSAWASSKTFHVGDTIVFNYNKQFHNVMRVTKANFDGCSASSAHATYTTGNDSIIIKKPGHHFFICGVPGHCSIGQKVDIRTVNHLPSTAPPSPINSPPSMVPVPPSPSGSSFTPIKNHASDTHKGEVLTLAMVAIVAISSFIMS